MIVDFGSFTRRGLLMDLERPVEIWAGESQTEQGRGGETREETVKDRETTDLPAVRE